MNDVQQLSKRDFLKGLASLVGGSAMLASLDAWGMGFQSTVNVPPELTGNAKGKKVLILGAGLTGLTAAYELSQRGYQCRILEARSYGGGRCQTARKGFRHQELGQPQQICDFDEGQYFNHGPWRIPMQHHSVLYYCRKFGLPLEIQININDNGYVIFNNIDGPMQGKRLRRREIMADMRAYTSELLAKVAEQGKLDGPLSKDDTEQLIDYLVHEGFLDPKDLTYKGTNERGYIKEMGAGTDPGPGIPSKPLAFQQLLQSGVGNIFRGVPSYERPYTMFQIQGGMDRLAVAFLERVGHMITYNAEIQEIMNKGDKAVVTYKDLLTGDTKQEQSEYCICTLPPGIVSRIKNNFTAAVNVALKAPVSAPAGKLALQMNRRFWEEDDGIFGGYSQTDDKEHRYTVYPSHDWYTDKGIVQGYYNIGPHAIKPSAMSPQQRAEYGLEIGEKFHPGQFRKHYGNKSFSVAWHLVNYSFGGWEMWSPEALREHYPKLLEPQGAVIFAGTYLTYLVGWQAGAIESAWQQIEKLHHEVVKG